MTKIFSLEISQIVGNGFPCIWNFGNSICRYNPFEPPIYFSLGDVLTAVGLLFAVIQLMSPLKKITLAVRGFQEKVLWSSICLALVFILIASNVPQLQYLGLPHPLNYALLWELAGFVLFVLAIIWFWFQASSYKNIFGKHNSERFFYVLLKEIADNRNGHLEASVSILNENLEKIIKVIKNKESQDPDKYASSLIDYVLSEKAVLEYIVTNRIDFLFNLLGLIKENKLSNREVGFIFSKIIKELYNNSNSYLYKQLDDYSGVSLYASLYDFIFKDKFFVKEFNVLQEWRTYSVSEKTLLNKDYISVYLKSIKKVIEFDGFSDNAICHQISLSLYELETFLRRANWTSEKQAEWYGSEVGDFLGRTFAELYEQAVKDKTIDESQQNYFPDTRKYRQNLSAAYAQSLVDYLSVLASADNKEMERHYALNATDRVLTIHKSEFDFHNIRNYFLEYIWQQIEDNVALGHFPAVLRIYLEIMLWNDQNMPDWRKTEREKLVTFLYTELAPRLDKNELMADYETSKKEALLPTHIEYSKKKFWWVSRDGTKKALKA